MKTKLTTLMLSLSLFILSISSYGNDEEQVYFHPVQEIFVDELPKSIADLEFVHSTSKLPVVFRGAAKNWEAMNWTPEYLKQKGIQGTEQILDKHSNYYRIYREHITFSKEGARETYSKLSSLLFEDIHYHEHNIYKDISEKDLTFLEKNSHFVSGFTDKYEHIIFIGSKGSGLGFHVHETTLLAEFYGEKIVFLAQPYPKSKLPYKQLDDESNRIINAMNNQEYDQLFDINNNQNNDYFSLQQVILKPGDILYIPSGWYHKIYYLTPCIGCAQSIDFDRANILY